MLRSEELRKARAEKQSVKCVVWDLDNSLWDGVLLEDGGVALREGVAEALAELDGRGIILSIASRNDHDLAMAKLAEFGLADYFLYPQINWNAKSSSIRTIAESLNIGLDALAFVDDQMFELDEVRFELPAVLCFDAADVKGMLARPELNPRFVTPESRLRRQLYASDIQRRRAEDEFTGASEEFLRQLNMSMTIKRAAEEDLQRAEELTVRTNQLNTTGYTYSYDELDAFRRSPDHLLLVASLSDRYGPYGSIGLSLVEKGSEYWTIKLFLMSCRVMSRGVGTILMHDIASRVKRAGARLRAEFIPNGRNRMMLVTYKFSGFEQVGRDGDLVLLENSLARPIPPCPDYVRLEVVG